MVATICLAGCTPKSDKPMLPIVSSYFSSTYPASSIRPSSASPKASGAKSQSQSPKSTKPSASAQSEKAIACAALRKADKKVNSLSDFNCREHIQIIDEKKSYSLLTDMTYAQKSENGKPTHFQLEKKEVENGNTILIQVYKDQTALYRRLDQYPPIKSYEYATLRDYVPQVRLPALTESDLLQCTVSRQDGRTQYKVTVSPDSVQAYLLDISNLTQYDGYRAEQYNLLFSIDRNGYLCEIKQSYKLTAQAGGKTQTYTAERHLIYENPGQCAVLHPFDFVSQ